MQGHLPFIPNGVAMDKAKVATVTEWPVQKPSKNFNIP